MSMALCIVAASMMLFTSYRATTAPIEIVSDNLENDGSEKDEVLLKLCPGVLSYREEPPQVYTDNRTNISVSVQWLCKDESSPFRTISWLYSLQNKSLDLLVFPDVNQDQRLTIKQNQTVRPGDCLSRIGYNSVDLDYIKHVSHVINTLQWKTVTVVTDREHSYTADVLLHGLAEHGVKSELLLLGSDEESFQSLTSDTDMKTVRTRLQIVVVCSFKCVNQSLIYAMEYDAGEGQGSLFRHFSFWLLVLEPGYLSLIENMSVLLDHVTVISLPHRLNSEIVVSDVVENSLSMHLNQTEDVINYISDSLRTHVNRTKCQINTLLWHGNGRQFSPVTITGNDSTLKDIFPNVQFGLNQRQLTAAALEWLPFTRRNVINKMVVYTQASVDQLHYLCEVLNFSYIMKEPEDMEWGRPHPEHPSKFTGLLGMLQRKEADIVVVPLGLSNERAFIVEFLPVLYAGANSIIIKKETDGSLISSALTDPFRWEVFAVGMAVLIGVTLLYMCIEDFNPYYQRRRARNVDTTVNTVLIFYGSAIQQGTVHLPRSCSGRMLLSFWWLFVIVMTSTYSGNLIASLTVVKEVLPYETFADVLADPKMRIGVLGSTVIQRTIQTSNGSDLQALWQRVMTSEQEDPRTLTTNIATHIERVESGGYGYLSDTTELRTIEKTTCDLFILNDYVLSTSYSMTLPKNSPLTDTFRKVILRIRENGMLQHLMNKWMPRVNDSHCTEKPKGAQTIGLKQISAVFLAVCVGVILAIVCLVLEIWLMSNSSKKDIK